MDFDGRAKVMSSKNIMIKIKRYKPKHIVFLLGKMAENKYSMDFCGPLCILQAFGIALSVF